MFSREEIISVRIIWKNIVSVARAQKKKRYETTKKDRLGYLRLQFDDFATLQKTTLFDYELL